MRPPYAGLRLGAKRAIRGNPVVLGRKFCASCGRWRPVFDFSPEKRTGGALSPYCKLCTARRHRTYHHAPHPPEWWELRREYSRIWTEAKRRAAGVPERNFHHRRSVIDRVEAVGLPVAPLVSAIERAGVADVALGAVAGVPPRSVYRLRMGGQELVRIDLADKLAHALGVPLALIYGDQPAVQLTTREPV